MVATVKELQKLNGGRINLFFEGQKRPIETKISPSLRNLKPGDKVKVSGNKISLL